MTDLQTRFHTLDELDAPNLWVEIESRAAAAQPRSDSTGLLALAAVTVLLVAALGTAALIGSGVVKLPVVRDLSPSLPAVASQAPSPTPSAGQHHTVPPGSFVMERWSGGGNSNELTTSHWAFLPGDAEPELVLESLPSNAVSVRWSPDDRWLTYLVTGPPPATPNLDFKPSGFVLAGPEGENPVRIDLPRPAADYAMPVRNRAIWAPIWAPSGSMFALPWITGGYRSACPTPGSCPSGIDLFDTNGNLVRTVPTPDGPFVVVWSPDSEVIGWTTGGCVGASPMVCSTDTFVTRAVLGPETQTSLALEPRVEVEGWSAEDRLLVTTVAWDPGNGVWTSDAVYTMRPDGTDKQSILWDAGDGLAAWSPDGRWLAIQPAADQFRIRNAQTGEEVIVSLPTGSDLGVWDWSPDSEWVALFRDGQGPRELYVVKRDGTQLRSLELGDDFAWAPGRTP